MRTGSRRHRRHDADQEAVRDVFFELMAINEGDPEQKRKAKSKRFYRTLERAEIKGLIGRREVEGAARVWFTEYAE